MLLCVKPIVVRAGSGQETFVSHFADPQRTRNPDYECVWLVMARVKAIAARKVKPANSVAAFAVLTDATAKGYAIRYRTLGFQKANWCGAVHKHKENTLLPI